MLHIEKLVGYTIPLYGNKRILPYGKLVVRDDEDMTTKTVDIKEDSGKQYFTFKRKRYYLHNAGTLYFPKFEIIQEHSKLSPPIFFYNSTKIKKALVIFE